MMIRNFLRYTPQALVLLVLVVPYVFANDPIKYGIELTFTNTEILKGGYSEIKGAIANWWKLVEGPCQAKGCKLEGTIRDGVDPTLKVTYPDGWWYEAHLDDGVVEVNAKPMTLKEYQKNSWRIQKDIFDFAKDQLGIKPHKVAGSGHIHIDVKTGFPTAKAVRNFFTDWNNHPGLALGALGNHAPNPPLALYSEKQRNAFVEVLKKFDETVLPDPKLSEADKMKKFAEELQKWVLFKTFLPLRPSAFKSQAINLWFLTGQIFAKDEGKTVEVRSIRPERNAQDLLLILSMLEARLNKIQKMNDLIPYKNIFVEMDRAHSNRIPNPQLAVDDFFDYIEGAGLKWSEYRSILPRELSDLKPTQIQKHQPEKNTGLCLPKEVDCIHLDSILKDYLPSEDLK